MKKSQLKNLIRQVIEEELDKLGEKEGVPHYTKDGKEWTGPTHKMPDGTLMTQNPHNKDSEKLYHKEDLTEGPDDCYHEYRIWTPNGIIHGNYFGNPGGGNNIFTCAKSNWLHSWLGFDSNPNKIASIKQIIPPNTGTHGFKANCIEFGGTSNTPGPMGTMHITNINALGGPAYNPSIEDFQTIEDCQKSYQRIRNPHEPVPSLKAL